MIKVGLIGLGKMGISHCSIVNAHPDAELVGICDSSQYARSIIGRYTGLPTFSDYRTMLSKAAPDAVFIATPSSSHASIVRACLDNGMGVFCEKPFTLNPDDAEQLVELAGDRGATTQVGYHNRFVGAFQEVKRLLDAGAIGTVTHVLGEAYGPVVLKEKGSTWRTKRAEGGGCLYDYAAHVVNLVNWYLGPPKGVSGTVLNRIFSKETEDEVSSTMYYTNGTTAQISANWSDESQRKMTTRLTLWGTAGRIFVDRQECQVYLRSTSALPAGYEEGWNARYTTDLTDPVWFYLRGEEYSAQIDHFIRAVAAGRPADTNDFASAAVTDSVISMMARDAERPLVPAPFQVLEPRSRESRWSLPIRRRSEVMG